MEEAAVKLREEFPGCQVVGVAADVSKPADVERLASKAVEELGQIVSSGSSSGGSGSSTSAAASVVAGCGAA